MTIDAVEQHCQMRRDQLETALHEMISAIEDYYGSAPFLFIEGDEATPGEYSFPANWIERWMGLIEPRTVELRKDDPHKRLQYFTLRFGSYIGILTGVKSVGGTRIELERTAQGLIRSIMGYERWRATLDAKNAGKGESHE
jgi:hypothetical protein